MAGKDGAPMDIHTLRGGLSVGASDDGQFAIFSFETFGAPVHIAVPNGDLARLITTAAHAYSPDMLGASRDGKPGRALRISGWSIARSQANSVAFSFEIGPEASLTFLIPADQAEGLPAALNAAMPMS
jgi:hypothetical protein